MIRQITGVVTGTEDNAVIVDVAGIGYLVRTNIETTSLIIGSDISLHTYLAVRETALDLYGFSTRDELSVFELLISLPKIGPKSALQVLCQADISLLKEAAREDDPAHLSKLSGIGKKSAEKIVAGLRDKWGEDDWGETVDTNNTSNSPAHTTDTIDALISLGYPASDARKVVVQISSENPEVNTSADALRLALRLLNSL